MLQSSGLSNLTPTPLNPRSDGQNGPASRERLDYIILFLVMRIHPKSLLQYAKQKNLVIRKCVECIGPAGKWLILAEEAINRLHFSYCRKLYSKSNYLPKNQHAITALLYFDFEIYSATKNVAT